MFVLLLTGFVSTSSAKNIYRNEAYKFRITFPEGWKVKRGSYPDPVVTASDIKGASINITTEKLTLIIQQICYHWHLYQKF